MTTRACLLGILLLSAAGRTGANEPMTLKVTPSVAFAPATLMVRATIESDARNRAVTIAAESPSFYRSSEIQLDGDRAPRTTMFEFRSLPSGVYEVKATLRDSTGEPLASVRSQVNVIASGSDSR